MSDFTKGPGYGSGKKKKRKIMKEFVMNEISAVDYGAQAPALAVLMKRRSNDDEVEKLVVLTDSVDGHQHAVYLRSWTFEEGGGETSESTSDGESGEHCHPFVVNVDGTLTIGEANGHVHTVDIAATIQRLRLENIVHDSGSVIEMRSPLVKREVGQAFTANDYALVDDPNRPETWKYRLTRKPGGSPDRRQVGNAVEALKRGRVPTDKKTSVMRRVRAAWLKCYDSNTTQMPPVLKRVSQ